MQTPSAELPRRTSKWTVVVSLLFSLHFAPICSQSICAQQSSPTAPPSVATRLALRLEMSFPNSVAFSPDGLRVIAACQDNSVLLRDVNPKSQTCGQLLRTLEGHTSGVSAASFSPDGRLAITGSLDKTARLWDVDPNSPAYGKSLLTLEGHADGLYCLCVVLSQGSTSAHGRSRQHGELVGCRSKFQKLWQVAPIVSRAQASSSCRCVFSRRDARAHR